MRSFSAGGNRRVHHVRQSVRGTKTVGEAHRSLSAHRPEEVGSRSRRQCSSNRFPWKALLPFVTPSEAEGSAVHRTLRNVFGAYSRSICFFRPHPPPPTPPTPTLYC